MFKFENSKEINNLLVKYSKYLSCENETLFQKITFDQNDKNDTLAKLLIIEARNGNEKARELFIVNCVDYVKRVIFCDSEISSYTSKGLDFEDILQVGILGVMDTINKYDFNQNVKVKTFLTINIKYAIKNYYRKYDPITISREAKSIYYNCSKKIDLLDEKVDTKLINELVSDLKIDRKKILMSIDAVKSKINMCYFDNEGMIDADREFIQKLGIKLYQEYQEAMDKDFNYRRILDAMNSLSERELEVMNGIFMDDKTQKQIANEMNLSVTAIGKIKNKAITKIRELVGV